MKKVRWSTRWWWYPRKLKDAIWALRWRFDPRHRYHVVKTDLKPGYYDIDTLMLETWMKLLRRYVERERGGVQELQEHINWLERERQETLAAGREWAAPSQGHIDMENEALAIHHWWTQERQKEWDEYERRFDNGYFTLPREELREQALKNHEAAEALHTKDEEMLSRMLKIRRSLWT